MISQKTIDEIFTIARVEEVIEDFVSLKRSGSNLKGLSPFSDERTPSFMVSPSKQIWKDFSSGKGGNVVSFLMEHEQFTYPEALRFLAKRYNIEIEEIDNHDSSQQEQAKEIEKLYGITEFAMQYFQDQLKTEEGEAIGYSYFKERKYNKTTIDKFKLGYSPRQRDALVNYALKKGYEEDVLIQTGLAIKGEGQTQAIDRFRERVVFPIFSFSGRPLGFGARILGTNTKTAKYLNSPESEIYHKSKVLYGLFQAKNSIRKNDQCILVEGYTDVLSLSQAGIENVVASSGTALTPDQIRLLKRITNNILLIYDGDSAGVKASFRGIDLLLEQEMNVEVLLLPEGEDPDSFARKNNESTLDTYIKENATDFIRFKTKALLAEVGESPVKKAKLVNEIVESISRVKNLIQREIYIRETAKILDIKESVLYSALAQQISTKSKEAEKQNQRTQKKLNISQTPAVDVFDERASLEKEIIKTLLNYGDKEIEWHDVDSGETLKEAVLGIILEQFKIDEIEFKTAQYKKMYDYFVEGVQENRIRGKDFFMNLPDEEIVKEASGMLIEMYQLGEWEKKGISIPPKERGLPKLVFDLIYRYKTLVIQDMIKEIETKPGEEEDRMGKLRKTQRLIILKNKLNKELSRIV